MVKEAIQNNDLVDDLYYPPEYRKLILRLSLCDVDELRGITRDWESFDRNIKIFARSVLKQKEPAKRRILAKKTYESAMLINDLDLRYGEILRSVIRNLSDDTLEKVIQSLDLP